MSQCLIVSRGSAWVSTSQCLRCLSVSGPPLCLTASPSQCLNVSMSQAGLPGPAWQCLNVSGGSAWASTERLNVSMPQLSRRGLPGPARSVSMSQLSRRGLPGPARSVSTYQCLSCLGGVCLGQLGALNVSMSQLSQGEFVWASTARFNVSMSQLSRRGLPGPARRSQCLNVSVVSGGVSVSQGGLPGGDQDQRSRVSMSQCLREVCLGETRTSVAVSMSQVSPCLWESLASEPAASVGEHPERRRASRASASIKVGFGLGCGKATQKKARPALPKPGTTPQPAKLPLEHTARAGRMQGSLVGLRVLRVRARGFGT